MTRALRGFAFAAALAAFPATAASVFLEDLTSPEVREAIAAGTTTILVPIGGTEQNGPHMALGKHNTRARALAGRIAERVGNALVAPVIAYVPEGPIDPPSAHMRFAGTISIPEDAFEKTLESAARSFRRHGFRDVVFLGDHGGYQASLRKVVDRLNRDPGSGLRAHVLEGYYVELAHAGREDTALTLAIDPSQVRADRIGPRSPADGVAGDARGATRDQGQALAEEIVRRGAEFVGRLRSRR